MAFLRRKRPWRCRTANPIGHDVEHEEQADLCNVCSVDVEKLEGQEEEHAEGRIPHAGVGIGALTLQPSSRRVVQTLPEVHSGRAQAGEEVRRFPEVLIVDSRADLDWRRRPRRPLRQQRAWRTCRRFSDLTAAMVILIPRPKSASDEPRPSTSSNGQPHPVPDSRRRAPSRCHRRCLIGERHPDGFGVLWGPLLA